MIPSGFQRGHVHDEIIFIKTRSYFAGMRRGGGGGVYLNAFLESRPRNQDLFGRLVDVERLVVFDSDAMPIAVRLHLSDHHTVVLNENRRVSKNKKKDQSQSKTTITTRPPNNTVRTATTRLKKT